MNWYRFEIYESEIQVGKIIGLVYAASFEDAKINIEDRYGECEIATIELMETYSTNGIIDFMGEMEVKLFEDFIEEYRCLRKRSSK